MFGILPDDSIHLKNRVIAYKEQLKVVLPPEEYEKNKDLYDEYDSDPCPGVIQTEMLMRQYNQYCKPSTNVTECTIKGFKRFILN